MIDDRKYLYALIHSELEDVVGRENVIDGEIERSVYGMDTYWISQMWVDRGGLPPRPDCIVIPSQTEQVAKVVKIAGKYNVPVVPFGAGSGSQGGITPIYGGIMIDLKRMNKIIRLDKISLTVTVQTGINTFDLEESLLAEGLTTNHYPASIFAATLGGFLAHRGSGVFSTKYGKIEEMTLGMEVVLPTAEIIRIKPVPSHSAGPNLCQLFTGSEGTLGIITEATLKIHPVSEERRFRGFLFPDMSSAFEAGRSLMAERLRPCVIRLYDENSTRKFIKRVLGISLDGVVVIFGFDGQKRLVDVQEEIAVEIFKGHHGKDMGRELGDNWWENRYKFYYPPYKPALPTAFGTMDTVSTFDNILPIYYGMKKAVEEGFPGATFTGHFSHWYDWGCMQYNRFFIDNPPQDPMEAFSLYHKVWNAGVRAAVANGGIINEHHGVGLKLARLMEENYGPAFAVLERIKMALDPKNIMNPGKLGFGGR